MAERYSRFVKSIPAATATTVYTAPDDGETTPGAAESVIIGFLVASTSTEAGEVTVQHTNYYDASTVKIMDTIPLPADTSVDLIPGKLVLQHAGNNASPAVMTGDSLQITSSKTCDVFISVVERV